MLRRTLISACAALSLGAGVTAATSVVAPATAAAKNCSAPKYPGSGYFTSLKVTGVSCTEGKRVALGHYRCRIKNGARGKCSSRVRNFRCSESRRSISSEFNSVVTCKRGSSRVVKFSYQQNL